MNQPARRPDGRDWVAMVVVGAVLGLVFLGAGGRLAMWAFALSSSRPVVVTLEGSVAVTLMGGGAGAIVGAILALSKAALPRRPAAAAALFWIIVLAVAWRGIRPPTPVSIALFMPLFVMHGALLRRYWSRFRTRKVDGRL